MSSDGEFKMLLDRRWFPQPVAMLPWSIGGPLEGPTSTVAPGFDGYTSTTTDKPRPPPPEPSRQVRRALDRAKRKVNDPSQ